MPAKLVTSKSTSTLSPNPATVGSAVTPPKVTDCVRLASKLTPESSDSGRFISKLNRTRSSIAAASSSSS